MIGEKTILGILENREELPDFFLVDLKILPGNKIRLFVDNENNITIRDCEVISKYIERILNERNEVFDLEVSSPGLDMPFRKIEQYEKNKGKNIEIMLENGIKKKGTLERSDKKGIYLKQIEKIKISGKKKKEIQSKTEYILFADIHTTKLIITFN